MLGFHQCRWGYNNIDDIYEVVKGYKDAEIPCKCCVCFDHGNQS